MRPSYYKPADQSDIFPMPDTYWDDLRVPVNSFHPIPSREPNWAAFRSGYLLEFTDEGSEPQEKAISFVAQLPHAWKEGTPIVPHIHWVGEDNTAGNVYWEFTYSWAARGEAFPVDTSIYSVGANGATDLHNYATFASISGVGKDISSMLVCQLKRKSTDALDTFDGKSAYLLEFDFHYEVDAPGSAEEATK